MVFKRALQIFKRALYPQKSRIHYVSVDGCLANAKEPCISAKEPCISAKEPCISVKEPCISEKDFCISAEQPCVCAEESYVYMYIFMYICICLRSCAEESSRMYVYIYMYICICLRSSCLLDPYIRHVWIYPHFDIHKCVYMCMTTCWHIYLSVCVFSGVETYIRDLYIRNRALCKYKTALHILKRAQYVRKRGPYTTGWRRCIGCLKLQVSFRKRAINYMALLRETNFKDRCVYFHVSRCIWHLRMSVCVFMCSDVYTCTYG